MQQPNPIPENDQPLALEAPAPFTVPEGFTFGDTFAYGHVESINDGRLKVFIKYTPGTKYRVAYMSQPNAVLSVAEMNQATAVGARLQRIANNLNEVQA